MEWLSRRQKSLAHALEPSGVRRFFSIVDEVWNRLGGSRLLCLCRRMKSGVQEVSSRSS